MAEKKSTINLGDLNINKILTVSTGHVTQQDMAKLKDRGPFNPVVTYPFEYGAFVWVPSFSTNENQDKKEMREAFNGMRQAGYSGAFRRLLSLAKEQGCRYLQLDCDGEYIPDLKTFSW
ncbi:MAG: hypothetical protein ACLQF0_06785 [Dissulfurispiraceae bacterium]